MKILFSSIATHLTYSCKGLCERYFPVTLWNSSEYLFRRDIKDMNKLLFIFKAILIEIKASEKLHVSK